MILCLYWAHAVIQDAIVSLFYDIVSQTNQYHSSVLHATDDTCTEYRPYGMKLHYPVLC
jgi:hypothetical protein